jgi:hypothetical protein
MRKIKLVTALIIVSCVICSCVNEDNRLGIDLMGDEDAIDVFQSGISSMVASTYKEDTLHTANYRYYVLGSYQDENFGKVSTSIYSQLNLSGTSEDFTSLGEADSCVLTLAYSGAYTKDTSTKSFQMNIQVYELSEKMDTSKTHSYDAFSVNNTPIFNSNVLIDPNSSVVLNNDTTKYDPHLRLKLSSPFMNKLIASSFSDNDAFQNEFKGVKIVANTTNNNAMAYVDMTSSLSGIILYYHTQSGYKGKYQINFPTTKGTLMHIDYDYSSSRFISALKGRHTRYNKDTITNNNYIFLASLGVAATKISITNLMSWYNKDSVKNSSINKAELILPVADVNNSNKKNYPSSLLCYRIDTAGNMVLIKDELVSATTYYTGRYDSTINAYRLQITSHLMNYLLGKYSTPDIYLVPNSRRATANRVVLNGINSSNPPKLKILFAHPNSK